MKKGYIFTSESVTEGHPDKICDQISDAIVDRFLLEDPLAYVVAECAISQSMVFVAVQFSTSTIIDIPLVAREVISEVGYNSGPVCGRTCNVLTSIKELPFDKHLRINEMALKGDGLNKIKVSHQVNAFGYACMQTPAYLPMSIWLAHKLAHRLTTARCTEAVPFLAPDGKTQVGVKYKGGKPSRISSITLQICADKSKKPPSEKHIREQIMKKVITPSFENEPIAPDKKTRIHIETDDPFASCGPMSHSGLSGRKTAIDTYGEFARNSASALSGKSPIRIDRIGAYAARYAAKNIVAAGLAEECELQLSYSVGLSQPVSILVETFGSNTIPNKEILSLTKTMFDFRPASIMKIFRLRYMPKIMKGGFYRKLAAYGHVGRLDLALPWEKTDRVADLKKAAGLG